MFKQLWLAFRRDKWKLLALFVGTLIVCYIPVWSGWIALKTGLPWSIIRKIILVEDVGVQILVFGALGLLPYWASDTRLTKQNRSSLITWVILIGVWAILYYCLWQLLPRQLMTSWRKALFHGGDFCWVYFGVCTSFIWRALKALIFLSFFPLMLSVLTKCTALQAMIRIPYHWGKGLVFGLLWALYVYGYVWVGSVLLLPSLAGALPKWKQNAFLLAFMALWTLMTYFFAVYEQRHPKKEKALSTSKIPPKDPALPPAPQQNPESKVFFDAMLAHDEAKVQQMITSNPELVRAVAPVKGNTALHVAAWNGWTNIATMILFVDKNTRLIQNSDGKYPFELAQQQGNLELAQLLKL